MEKFICHTFKLSAFLFCIISTHAVAAIIPLTSDTQINLISSGDQRYPQVASDAAGNYAIVYNHYDPATQTRSAFFQRYSAAGNFLGGYQFLSVIAEDIAMNSNGTAVVVFGPSVSSNADNNIYIQVFDNAGNPRFSGLPRLNQSIVGSKSGAVVSINDQEEITVAWKVSQGATSQNINVRQLSSFGYFISPEISVYSQNVNRSFLKTDVKMSSSGKFLLSWSEISNGNMAIYGRRYNLGGQPQGGRFIVNQSSGVVNYPSIGMRQDNGDFFISWHRFNYADDKWDIKLQRFNASAVKLGGAITVNVDGESEPSSNIDMDSNGVTLVWNKVIGIDSEVYVQSFNLDGSLKSPAVQMNGYIFGMQNLPAVTRLPNSNLLGVWTSRGQDGSGEGVYAKRFIDQ